jgi:hypothetical protein
MLLSIYAYGEYNIRRKLFPVSPELVHLVGPPPLYLITGNKFKEMDRKGKGKTTTQKKTFIYPLSQGEFSYSRTPLCKSPLLL